MTSVPAAPAGKTGVAPSWRRVPCREHLAGLAVAHRVVIVSFDNDFSRFAGVPWEEPAA